MNVATYLASQWIQSGYLLRTAAVITAVPVTIWGASSIEAVARSILRLGHTLIATNSADRHQRWTWTKLHAWDALACAGMSILSMIPFIGTYYSFDALYTEMSNHVTNTWKLRELDYQVADRLYRELINSKAEPDINSLLHYATDKIEPNEEERKKISTKLKGTLIGRNWLHTICFRLVDNSCRAVRVIAVRIGRIASTIIRILAAGHIFRAIKRAVTVIANAVAEEAMHARNLVEQKGRIAVPKTNIPELSRDIIQQLATAGNENEMMKFNDRTKGKITSSFEKSSSRELQAMIMKSWRNAATSNIRVQQEIPGALVPEGAPANYLHKVKYLANACKKETNANWILGTAHHSENYFPPIFPFLEKFDMRWINKEKMPFAERQKLIWELSTRLPNLSEVCLDMQEIDPAMQMLISLKIARSSPKLKQATFVNADPRALDIMRKFTGWGCQVK